MRFFRRISLFAILFFIITQFSFSFLAGTELAYKDRVKYRVFKNNTDAIEAAIDSIKRQIERDRLNDYAIILGDSVAFSTPVGEEESLAPLLNKLAASDGYKTVFFNLAIPSEYPGDIYVLIKMLNQHGISTQHMIINFNYAEFLFDQYATGVFWLKEQLKDVDPGLYKQIYDGKEKRPLITRLKDRLAHALDSNISILQYKDYIRAWLSSLLVKDYHDTLGDIRPWYEKKDLPDELKKNANNWYFSDRSIVLDESRSCVLFVDKIAGFSDGKHVLVFLPGYNRELLKEELSKEGYNRNLASIDAYFSKLPFQYVDYDRKINYSLYSDFVHLVPEGYEALARDIWTRFKAGLDKN